jgi:hypothetical protein
MSKLEIFENIAADVYLFDRARIVDELLHFASFPLDLTQEYLATCPTEKLRHLLAAALWRAHTRGGVETTHARA